MHMLCKTGTVCLRVADSHFISDRICVRTLLTHMHCLLPEDLALDLNQVFIFCPVSLLPSLLSGGDMQSNSTPGSTIGPAKQWVLVIGVIIIIANNCPPPHLCTMYHEPIVCVIYNIFSQIILEISLYLRHPSNALVFQPYIDHIHLKNRQVEPL